MNKKCKPLISLRYVANVSGDGSGSLRLLPLQHRALAWIDQTGILWLSPGTLFLPADCWIRRILICTSDVYPDVNLLHTFDTSQLGQTPSDHK